MTSTTTAAADGTALDGMNREEMAYRARKAGQHVETEGGTLCAICAEGMAPESDAYAFVKLVPAEWGCYNCRGACVCHKQEG